MTWSGLVCGAIVLGGCGICSAVESIAPPQPAAQVGDANNSFPYVVIVKRNAFGLYPAPPPPGPTPAPGPELPKVIFKGTRQRGSHLWAMFAVKTTDAKKQETTTYMSLAEGETSGPVQLISISPGGEEVEIMNSGTRMALNMKDNGFEKTGLAATGALTPPGMRVLPGSPGISMSGLPAQAPGQATTSDGGPGINVRRSGSPPTSSGITVGGQAPATSGGPINPAATFQAIINTPGASFAANNGRTGIKVVGPTAPPNNPVALIPGAPPTGGMPLNSTPLPRL